MSITLETTSVSAASWNQEFLYGSGERFKLPLPECNAHQLNEKIAARQKHPGARIWHEWRRACVRWQHM